MGQHNPHGEHVPATNLENGLSKCVNFVQNCDAKPVIVGHNILNFFICRDPVSYKHLKKICKSLGKCLIKES